MPSQNRKARNEAPDILCQSHIPTVLRIKWQFSERTNTPWKDVRTLERRQCWLASGTQAPGFADNTVPQATGDRLGIGKPVVREKRGGIKVDRPVRGGTEPPAQRHVGQTAQQYKIPETVVKARWRILAM